ncbi:MAG: hypothetical protein RJA59_2024 [Pseudomonadota bacterium]
MHVPAPRWFPVAPVRFLAVAALFAAACGGSSSPAPAPPGWIFTDPVVKIAETADSSFADTIHAEALVLQPLLGASGTQVHMGYFSGSAPGADGVWKANSVRLVALMDTVNAPPPGAPPRWMVWDRGVTTVPSGWFPSYTTMVAEHFEERAQAEAGGGNTVTVDGVTYVDPYPVTYQQSDLIWGQASERFVETAARYHRATGNKVKVWAYVVGARQGGVFYQYECPFLGTIAFWGHAEVHCSKVADADWSNPADWCDCSTNCTAVGSPSKPACAN